MVKVIVQHHVADYDQWLPVYEEHGEVRRRYGATGHQILREIADPGSLVVINEFATLDGARGFATDASLPAVMQRAGVDSVPQVWIVEAGEASAY